MEIVDKRGSAETTKQSEYARFLAACEAGEVTEWRVTPEQSVALAIEVAMSGNIPEGDFKINVPEGVTEGMQGGMSVASLRRPDDVWIAVIVDQPEEAEPAIPTVTFTFIEGGEVRVDLSGGATLEEQVAAAYAIERTAVGDIDRPSLSPRDDTVVIVTFDGPKRIPVVSGSDTLTVPQFLLAATFLRSRAEYVLNQSFYMELVNLITQNVVGNVQNLLLGMRAGAMAGQGGPGSRLVLPR